MTMNSEGSLGTVSRSLTMAPESSVAQRPRNVRAKITSLDDDSVSFLAGIHVGDIVTHVNGEPVMDIVDWSFLTAGEHVSITVDRLDFGSLTFAISKGYDEDLGIEFDDDLFDRVHICKNKCVFCFLYQQPKGLRPTLYIKDDDYRLSFLHGNYLTLTNMSDQDFARVIEQKLSPLYVSVHATEPELRGRMLGRKSAEPILPRLEMLSAAGISIHAQVVLCPGYNDGAPLIQTINELADLHPNKRMRYGGVLSMAVVPVGLTQFRDRLASLKACDSEYAFTLVTASEGWRKNFRKSLGTSFVFLSDEFYIASGIEVPSTRAYEGFPQLEDGVGLVRQFIDDLKRLSQRLPSAASQKRSATLVTGVLAGPFVQQLADVLNKVDGLYINVCIVVNDFFAGNIGVAGLLTGNDIVRSLLGMGSDLGDFVIIPSIMLRDPDRDVFLDDMTLAEFAERVRRTVCVIDRTPSAAATLLLEGDPELWTTASQLTMRNMSN